MILFLKTINYLNIFTPMNINAIAVMMLFFADFIQFTQSICYRVYI